MKVVVTTVEHQYKFFIINGELFCIIDEEELRGPCLIIGKKKFAIGEPIDVICGKEEEDFLTSPVEKIDVIFE